MRKQLFLLVAAVIMVAGVVSCSKDDDGKAVIPTENLRQTLVNGSPWICDKIEILQVTYNWDDLPNSEILEIFNLYWGDSSFIFREDGTGFYTYNDGERYDITWNFGVKNDGGIDYSVIVTNGGTLDNVVIKNNSLSFNGYEYCAGYDPLIEDVCADLRFTYK